MELLTTFIVWLSPAVCSRNITMYLVLSAFTSSPISLVATTRASAFSVCKLLTPGFQNQRCGTKSTNCFTSSPLLSCSPSRHGDQGFYNSLHVFFHKAANGRHLQGKRSGVRIPNTSLVFHSFRNKSPDLCISRLYHLLMTSRLLLQDIKARTQFFAGVQPQLPEWKAEISVWKNIHDSKSDVRHRKLCIILSKLRGIYKNFTFSLFLRQYKLSSFITFALLTL